MFLLTVSLRRARRLGETKRVAKDGWSGWSEATAVYHLCLLKQITCSLSLRYSPSLFFSHIRRFAHHTFFCSFSPSQSHSRLLHEAVRSKERSGILVSNKQHAQLLPSFLPYFLPALDPHSTPIPYLCKAAAIATVIATHCARLTTASRAPKDVKLKETSSSQVNIALISGASSL